MRINAKRYDDFIKRHRKAIIAVWILAFIISIPLASHLFSVVSYNISGSSSNSSPPNSSINNSNSSIGNSKGSHFNNLIVLLVESNDIYSNNSKTFFVQLMDDFPKSNVTSIYGIEQLLLDKSYSLISGIASQAETVYKLRYGLTGQLNSTQLSQISYIVTQNFTSLVSASSLLPIQLGSNLISFVSDIVHGYANSSPQHVFNSYNFSEYPVFPSRNTLVPLVNGAHNVTLATMTPANYSNASSFIGELAQNYPIKVSIAGFQALESSLESNTLSGTFFAILAGLFIAIIVTGFIFRSPVAAFIPLLIFGVNIVISYAVFYSIFHFILNTQISFFDPVLTSILMLGLCTDYLIYILYRYRQERIEGNSQEKSASLAFGWAGGSVLVSGITVISAYVVLSFLNLPFIGGSGILNSVGISIVLLSALTLLPASLYQSGDKLIYPHHNRKSNFGGIFRRIAEFDMKNAKSIITIFVILAAISFYVFITFTPDLNILGLLPNSPIKSTFYTAANNFGYDPMDPLTLTFSNTSAYPQINSVASKIGSIGGIYAVLPASVATQSYSIYLKDQAFSKSALNTYNSLSSYLNGTGVPYTLSGTAQFIAGAYNAINSDVYPLILILGTVIFAILFIILFSVFTPLRLVLMLIAILMIANAITVLIFSIILSLPFIVFAQVFLITNIMGVGVDYDIFLVMRIREHSLKGSRNSQAVKDGVTRSGPVILSLGVILSSVFFGLATAGIPLITQVGFIVGAGILLDTFISVLIIIPSFMFLLSKYNWWPSRMSYAKSR